MPLYEYKCTNGHVHQRLRRMDERDNPARCIQCDADATPIISAPHVPPDGVYSYCPNVGSMDTFDRKRAKIEKMNEAKRDGKKPKLIDQI